MNIVIIGQGGHSKVVKELILQNKEQRIVGFLDDRYEAVKIEKNTFYGPISSYEQLLTIHSNLKFVIAIGDNSIRKKIHQKLHLPDSYLITLIHPTAVISPSAKIGNGSVIMINTVINAEAEIGSHTIINTGTVVEHECIVGDYTHISPNSTLTGGVRVGEGVHIGAGSTIIPNIEIGEWSIIGAGSTVIRTIPPNSLAVGVPAKIKNNYSIEGV
ncbi:MAG: acetyltransferase [Heyndrickxia sp.]